MSTLPDDEARLLRDLFATKYGDTEGDHVKADDRIVEHFRKRGWDKVADWLDRQEWWYA